jgi:hypothetical protein
MPNYVQMLKLRTRAQQLADMENDPSIGLTEWNADISERYGEVWEDVNDAGYRYSESFQTFSIPADFLVRDGFSYLPEPENQLAIVDRLELVVNASTGRCRRLKRIGAQERARWSGLTGGSPRAYELADGGYYLYPLPTSGTITLRFIPQAPDLTNFTDTQLVDCVSTAGFNFMIYAAAAAAVLKSQRDPTELTKRAEFYRTKLIEWAGNRAFNDGPAWYTEDEDDDACWPDGWS